MADREASIAEIKERAVESFDAFNSGDIERCVGCYAPDAKLMAPGIKAASGSEGIREALKNSIDTLKLDYEIIECQVAGPHVGYSVAISDAKDASGNPKGKFQNLVLWRKMDGKWYAYREMFNATQ